jgi:hypothetical protein
MATAVAPPPSTGTAPLGTPSTSLGATAVAPPPSPASLPANQYLFITIETGEETTATDGSGVFLNGITKTENPFAIQDGKNSNTSFYDDSGKLSLICFEKIPRTALKNLPPGGMNFMYVVTRYVNLSTSVLTSIGDDLMFYSPSGSGYDGIQAVVKQVEEMEKTPPREQINILSLNGGGGPEVIQSIASYEGDIVDDDAFRKLKGTKGISAALKSIQKEYKGLIFGSKLPIVGASMEKGFITP